MTTLNTKALRAEARKTLRAALGHLDHRAYGSLPLLTKLVALGLLTERAGATPHTGSHRFWTLTPEGAEVAKAII